MLKVECESCKAPYQIDERRVPPSGLKMRCPKCGHSFMVTLPGGAAAAAPAAPAAPPAAKMTSPATPAAVAPRPAPTTSAAAALKRTMVGVAPPAAPPAQAPAAPPPPRPPLPSDFPAALGSLDESDLPIVSGGLPASRSVDLPATKSADLPVAEGADLPARKRAPPAAPGPPIAPVVPAGFKAAPAAPKPAPSFEVDLPVVAPDLPATKSGAGMVGLPVVAADLPVPAASLPSRARGFGEIDLPELAESLPTAAHPDRHLPAATDAGRHLPARPPSAPPIQLGDFGEIDLPREAPASAADAQPAPPRIESVPPESADFGDLELEDRPRSNRGGSAVVPADSLRDIPRASGGMTFGEVDFGGGAAGGTPQAIGIDTNAMADAVGAPAVQAAASAPVGQSFRPPALRERPDRAEAAPKKRSAAKLVAGALLVAAVLGGAALQLTPYGAYGYLYVGDLVHAKDYVSATASAIVDAQKGLSADTYDAAKAAVDAVAAAHARTPRDKPLTAYAAFVDSATTVRFGEDVSRAPRAKLLLSELPSGEPVEYLDVAMAAQSAASGKLDAARKALDAAVARYAGDPVLRDVELLRGEVALATKDGQGALAAFRHALALSNDARARFGLARAYDLLGDAADAKKEMDATLAASPLHPGALTLRARRKSAPVDGEQALADIEKVVDGPARAKASPVELSAAYAAKAWISLEQGAASEARDAFAQAVKLNPRNVDALTGEGRLLLNEGRYTEALARFDTALQYDGTSPEIIASDAEAKLALERLADAKQQLLDAKTRYPKSLPVLMLLGKVEQHLGNLDEAEADLRSAVSFVDPSKRDAVLPYVALSELLAARGRVSDAKTALDDAKKKLPPSPALDRAFGEVAELQGDYDAAVADYREALRKDPKDPAAHFRLAVVLRRMRKFDEAGAELDAVAAVDKDYPGLSLERGLLFEESGDVEKAIEQFKSALAKAPDDPDLQLRVGSAYVAIGRPDDALPMLRKVLDKRPNSAEANHYIGRALMLQGAGSQSDALRYLKRAVELDPNRAEFHVYLAWAANDAQPAQLELARDEIDKALALDKLDPEAYWQKGVLERMEGAIEDAIKDEKRALELRPSRYEAHATLAECYEDKNDDATAMAEWVKAIAGDGKTTLPDGSVPHPYWRFEYGKMLMDKGSAGAALAQLQPAVKAAEAMQPRPGWLAPLEFLTAEALRKTGHKTDAAEHYRRFLDIAPVNSPDRLDAQNALTQLGGNN